MNKIELINMQSTEDKKIYKFVVTHNTVNYKTTLTSNLIIEHNTKFNTYNPIIEFTDFPKIDNVFDAVVKYNEWMERTSVVLRDCIDMIRVIKI